MTKEESQKLNDRRDISHKAHTVSFMSGKGGTGKTVIATTFGTLLLKAGFKVLFVDLDHATDGMSLFIAGATGFGSDDPNHIKRFDYVSDIFGKDSITPLQPYRTTTLTSISKDYKESEFLCHWSVLFSSPQVFGGTSDNVNGILGYETQQKYKSSLDRLFDAIHQDGSYDYVIVDTRGGFDYATALVAQHIDSLILVTEPDQSSLNQSSRLAESILYARRTQEKSALFKGLIVNKSTHRIRSEEKTWIEDAELDFRTSFERHVGLPYKSHFVLPLDSSVVVCYRDSLVPALHSPGSIFSLSLFHAFTELFSSQIGKWENKSLENWKAISDVLLDANQQRIDEENREHRHLIETDSQYLALSNEKDKLERDLSRSSEDVHFYKKALERDEDQSKKYLDRQTRELARLENHIGSQRHTFEDTILKIETSFLLKSKSSSEEILARIDNTHDELQQYTMNMEKLISENAYLSRSNRLEQRRSNVYTIFTVSLLFIFGIFLSQDSILMLISFIQDIGVGP